MTLNVFKGSLFWASRERQAPAADFLEVDLGRARIVNLIEFDITHKPITLDIHYDQLGQAPKRSWAAIEPWADLPFVDRIVYDPHELPWKHILMAFKGSRQTTVTTRFIRLKFTREVPNPVLDGPSPLIDPVTQQPIKTSVEVKNLRVGRYANP